VSQTDLTRFRTMCGQFRWLAVFMVVTIGGGVTFALLVAPLWLWMRDGREPYSALSVMGLIWFTPIVFYLFGVWSIGSALGQIARGRLIQPVLASALRRVGLALGVGGLLSVFVVPNAMRWLGNVQSSYLNFDVASMTLGMMGGALFLLGRVMDQAGRIQAELDEMI
jgi:hypothetical protein